jgi:hypothetical protein
LPADRADHVNFGGDGRPELSLSLGLRYGCAGGGVIVPRFFLALAGLVLGVGEARVDGVVQVEAFAVPGGDDRSRGNVGVVAVVDGAV